MTYTGATHSINYIDILAKDFNFEITHASYCDSTIPEANQNIKNYDTTELAKLFYPPIFQQCSDMTTFPKNFD